jgi:hypothetical protein
MIYGRVFFSETFGCHNISGLRSDCAPYYGFMYSIRTELTIHVDYNVLKGL